MQGEIDNWYNEVLTILVMSSGPSLNEAIIHSESDDESLPEGVLVAWYGDDFTGAAAVLEVLAFADLNSMLFLDVPTPEQLARYPNLRGIGVASTARAQTPDWMDANLPGIFERLSALDPAIVHYKICSTLDSSPQIGSIGRAIEIAATQWSPDLVPILVAAPQMRRYQCFGQLFAGMGDNVFRLDRHPVMARHPVTPMVEADVAAHIGNQSERLKIGNVSMETIANDNPGAEQTPSDGTISAVTLDCWDDSSEAAAGRYIWQARSKNPFVVGSQGVEYALVRYWQESGALPSTPPPSSIGRAEKMVTVSGSVSPTTAEQIAWSRENGFSCIAFNASLSCANDEMFEREIERVVEASLSAFASGQDPLVYTAEGPDDPAVAKFKQTVADSEFDLAAANKRIGVALGRVLHQVLQESGAERAIVSGGDTSGYATQQLGIFALSALAPTIPAAAIFRAHASGPMDGLQLALKGGQMGSADYFGWVRDGGGVR